MNKEDITPEFKRMCAAKHILIPFVNGTSLHNIAREEGLDLKLVEVLLRRCIIETVESMKHAVGVCYEHGHTLEELQAEIDEKCLQKIWGNLP